MVWIAILGSGLSEPYFRKYRYLIDQCVYCYLEPYLLPFTKEYHKEDKFVFWPEQASAHYAFSVQDWLNSKKIPFEPKNLNPVNLLKVVPIEDFWGILKAKVHENNSSAKNIEKLKKKIKKCL